MNCESVQESADLYLYGELAGQEEENIEQHLHGCPACRTELDRQKALHRSLDNLRMAPPVDLLAECRQDLFRIRPAEKRPSPWMAFLAMRRPLAVAQPLGALALVSLGFFSARLTTRDANLTANLASKARDPISSTIRSGQPDESGHVQIALHETRRQMVTGILTDGKIARVILAATSGA